MNIPLLLLFIVMLFPSIGFGYGLFVEHETCPLAVLFLVMTVLVFFQLIRGCCGS